MAVFITGGHGHIGSWAAKHLAAEGQDVILFDTNPRAPDCLQGLEKRITFIRGSVLVFPQLTEAINRHRDAIDGVLHTVGVMGEMVLANPYANVQLNLTGTHNVLEAVRQFEVPKYVFTSTGAVYGEVPGVVAEGDHLPNPSDLYGATKTSCEYLSLHYANSFGFDCRISRVFFCYGPGKLPSTFIRLYQMAFGALEGLLDLKMDYGGDQKLDFTYIEDAARGTAMLYDATEVDHRIYNIATGVPRSIADAAALSQQHSPYDVRVEMGPGVLMKRCEALDIDRARKELGYAPRYDLESGVEAYARWMQSQ
jgi:nucleoside-diphosphate-sugar epimerase